MVLVDGDGALFHDSFLEVPGAGAIEAAHKLKQHVKDHLDHSMALNDSDLPIFTRVFAGLRGLAYASRAAGVVETEDQVLEFAERFTNSCAEFDVINVGRGKENADSKMRS